MAGIARNENEPALTIAQGEDEGLVHDHVQSVVLFERACAMAGNFVNFKSHRYLREIAAALCLRQDD
jgi:hypothetical protein